MIAVVLAVRKLRAVGASPYNAGMEPSPAPAVESLDFGALPIVSRVEVDRFCDNCGYNLLTQTVRRDPRTQILITRCPECGRIHPAAQVTTVASVWLRRLAMLGLGTWMLFLANVFFWACVSQIAITYFTLDELTTHVPKPGTPLPVGGNYNPNTQYWLQPRHNYRDIEILYAVSAGVSSGLGFVLAWGATVLFPHWRRQAYTVSALAWPVLCGMLVVLIWRTEAPHLLRWGMPYIGGHYLLCCLGGVVAIMIGRPLARLIVRICLPSRARALLAYLWLVDGKTPPV